MDNLFEKKLHMAEQGDMVAQYELGFMYFYGYKCDEDRDKSIMWYAKSAKQGDKYAKEALKSEDIICNTYKPVAIISVLYVALSILIYHLYNYVLPFSCGMFIYAIFMSQIYLFSLIIGRLTIQGIFSCKTRDVVTIVYPVILLILVVGRWYSICN
jgi:hypothetical protein